VIIRLFKPADQAAARRLILEGLGEHFGFIDETRNPDLDDIARHYLAAGHAFLVAEADGELIGTGGLIAFSADTGRIVRMSVSRDHRRRGVGRAVVARLLDLARERGYSRVVVRTEPDWTAAIGLYTSFGFAEYDRDDEDIYFSLML
jgi:GNAT superfamily N-acetyltransferase